MKYPLKVQKRSLNDFAYDVWEWNNHAGQIKTDESAEYPDLTSFEQWKHDPEYRRLALSIFLEEVRELDLAVRDNDTVETWDAIADVLFTLLGIVTKMDGEDVLPLILQEVIDSNNTKLQGNPGSATKKLGKGPNYKAPQIKEILKEHGMA